MIALLTWGVVESINPYFYQLFVDALPSKNLGQLTWILLAYIGIRLLNLILDVITLWLGDSVLLPAARDARVAVFNKIQDLDFAYHLTKSTGSLISGIKRGDLAFFNIHHAVNIQMVKIFINFLVMLYFFAQINFAIVAVLFISVVINMTLAVFLIKNNIKARIAFNKSEDQISGVIVDNLLNFETVKLFAKEDKELKRLKADFIDWLRKLWGYANSFRMIDIVVGSIGNLGLFLVLLLGLNQVTTDLITTGQFIMVLSFVNTFYYRFFQLVYELRNLAKNQADIQKYFEVLDKETQVKDPIRPIKIKKIKGEIEFRNVSFSYPDGKDGALQNVDLKIRQGQSIAFVGHSGAGKTTITKLLMRFYDPDHGQILLDKVNIKDMTKSHLRSFMGVVPQEPIMFNNTIGFNIGYGSKNVTKKEIRAAAKMANLDDFIQTLPDKYQTNVGERGVKLSGGQKQRLAIARMILSDPEIIIFDEATSQLDSESEKLIQDAFWKASKDKTTIIIAHRLSSIVKAEKIVVMEDGKVAEIGSHRELLNKKSSIYKKFWQLQTSE